jgi:hypothetical protein
VYCRRALRLRLVRAVWLGVTVLMMVRERRGRPGRVLVLWVLEA